jgi:hypothetical protein
VQEVRWSRRRRWSLVAILCGASLLGCSEKGGNPAAPPVSLTLGLQPVGNGAVAFPVFLTAPPGDARLFVVEKGGRIRIIENGTLLATPFLDISGLVSGDSEQGLLGLAFDPGYAINGRFYVSYTDHADSVKVARYLVSGNPDVAQPSVQRILLSVYKPATNHNGGMITFGPDGMLYAGFGDGGGGGDQYGKGQDRSDLLGSLIRIDVSGAGGYVVPAGNPALGAPELWDYGLRNPWRFSFDRGTGDLYIGDVGQDTQEEIDVSTAASGGGKGSNYGWSIVEGADCFPPGTNGCNQAGLVRPVVAYDHGVSDINGCSVIGGYVYRGNAIPSLRGTYFYGDYCGGWVRSFRLRLGAASESTDWVGLRPGGNVTSFGEDSSGELYVLTQQGAVDRIVAR